MKEREIKAVINEKENLNGIIHLEPLKGPNGLSAYEVYVKNVPEDEIIMSEQEWLESLSKINYYREYKQIFISSKDDTTIIPFQINEYNDTCLLEIYINGLKLLDSEYILNKELKEITLTKPIDEGQEVFIVVSKTIVATAENFDLLKGEKGENGVGVPTGGKENQVLIKNSDVDYDFKWADYTGESETVKVIVNNDDTPVGTIIAYPSSTIPEGWIIADGRELSRTEYKDLFKAIGTTYGSGNGSTTFNLPNSKGRVTVGFDIGQDEFRNLGETGGNKNIQKHNHSLNMAVNAGTGNLGNGYGLNIGNPRFFINTNNQTEGEMTGWGTSDYGTGDSGNLQPYIVVNYIIKVKKKENTSTNLHVIFDAIYPIGRGFIDFTNTDYSNYLGFTWERELVGMTAVGLDTTQTEFDIIGKTGGEKKHKHLGSNVYITTGGSNYIGSSNVFGIKNIGTIQNFYGSKIDVNNATADANSATRYYTSEESLLQPYKVVAYWKRIA